MISFQLTIDDGLPTNICHRCLYNTELFSEFREGVHQCERKLQDFVSSLASHSTENTRPEWQLDEILHDQQESSEFNQNNVVIIDPLKCYESSDEELDDERITEIQRYSELNTEPMMTMPIQSALPVNNRSTFKPPNKSSNEEVRPLRNVSFCRYCEAPFILRQDCEAHENTHDPSLPFACNFCPFRCDNQTNHIGHIRQCHDSERPYWCTRCNKHFGRRADLRKHGVSHTGIRPFSCPICGKAFSRKTNVTNHMKVHEGKKARIKDSTSPGKKQSPAKKLQHQKVAYGPPPASMEGFQPFSSQGYPTSQFSPSTSENAIYSKCTVKSEPNTIPKLKLKLKLKKKPFQVSATSVRKFECPTCKKTFKTKRDMDRHTQIHNGMKFQCSVCQKGFARRDKLVRHEKIHTNRSKTAALPESAFLPENLKRSHFAAEHRSSPATGAAVEKQSFTMDTFRPQFYAEYDLSEANN